MVFQGKWNGVTVAIKQLRLNQVLTFLTEIALTVLILLPELVLTVLIFLTELALTLLVFLPELVLTGLVFLTCLALLLYRYLTELALSYCADMSY